MHVLQNSCTTPTRPTIEWRHRSRYPRGSAARTYMLIHSITFLLDEHVAHAVAQALRRRGIDAQTTTEAGLLGATAAELLAYARRAGRVLVTHDDDFLRDTKR